ncbi:tyrosine protein phosphatase yvh1 [Ascosphaera pollenicola]|nr:tyrosine protein phosphatase yvh1 [Ascosphaera pollenicola]
MPAEASAANNAGKTRPQQHARRSGNRDEFDGAVQTLPLPGTDVTMAMDQKAMSGRVSLEPRVQAQVMNLLTTYLSKSAFDWVARYQFPIPRSADRPPVTCPEDRTWNEWAYLLKRLATKRRIPARLLRNSHIKAFVPTMENSTIVPQPSNGAVIMMEDRYLLQVISAGIQVTRLIQDGHSTYSLLNLYNEVSNLISKGLVSKYVKSQNADNSCAV